MRLTSPSTIELTQVEREVLERLADSRTAGFGQVQRASVILALAEGMFTSRDELAAAIDTFVLAHDEHDAYLYRWTYDGSPLKAA
ncbi:hypothetical protein ACIBW9_34200 [Streptomyces sp. NPDC049541]|uniref:hypothetical protein n=1 Tax=Streptomyces sp. NPDC049541 TaxID=3365594 RepID=UPI00379EB9F3